jgi:hypothetical protein
VCSQLQPDRHSSAIRTDTFNRDTPATWKLQRITMRVMSAAAAP